jgi:hypothetical protein
MIEVNIGIWCASIPPLRILLIRRRAVSQISHSADTYQYHSSERSRGKSLGNNGSKRREAFEDFDMGAVDLTKPQAARKASKDDGDWSGRVSDDQIYSPSAYNPLSKLPV